MKTFVVICEVNGIRGRHVMVNVKANSEFEAWNLAVEAVINSGYSSAVVVKCNETI